MITTLLCISFLSTFDGDKKALFAFLCEASRLSSLPEDYCMTDLTPFLGGLDFDLILIFFIVGLT